jgi:hypothetical protein
MMLLQASIMNWRRQNLVRFNSEIYEKLNVFALFLETYVKIQWAVFA